MGAGSVKPPGFAIGHNGPAGSIQLIQHTDSGLARILARRLAIAGFIWPIQISVPDVGQAGNSRPIRSGKPVG